MTKFNPLSFSIRGRLLAPAAFALALSWSGAHALADAAGTKALNDRLALYAPEETPPGGKQPTLTVATASDTDLVRAVYDILANGPNPSGVTAAELASSALEGRKDASTVAPRVVNAAIVAGNVTVTSTADIVAIVNAVLTDPSVKLTPAAQEAVTAVALTDDADPASTAGTTIAQIVFSTALTGATQKTQLAFVEGTLKTIQGSADLPSFVEQAVNTIGSPTTSAIGIAAADAANPAAVNAAIAGGAATLAGNDQSVESFVKTALANSKLSKVLSDVVAGGGTALTTDSAVTYATNLAVNQTKIATLEGIASGALRLPVAGGATTGGKNGTSDILSAVFTGANAVTAKNAAAIAAGVGVGTGSVDVNGTTRAAELAQILETDANAGGPKTQTAVAEAIIKDIGVNAPGAAGGVAAATATAEGVNTNLASSETLAGTLAKAASSTSAAGSVAAGIADLAAFNTNTGDQSSIAAAAIKGNSKAATNIALDVTSLVTAANQESFGITLATASQVSASSIPSVVAGSAAAFGDAIEVVNSTQVYTVTDFVTSVLVANGGILKPNAIKIATAAAGAVDEEEIANIATAVAGLLGTSPKLKLSAASSLATALVKAAEAKPAVDFNSRTQEVAEIAASIVAGVVGKSSVAGDLPTQNAGFEEKLIASIGSAVIKAIGTKLSSNVELASNVPVDLKDALVLQSVAGAIAQTIAVAQTTSAFSETVQNDLLSPTGALAIALAKAVGKAYASLVNGPLSNGQEGAFTAVDGAFLAHQANSNVPVIVAGPNSIGTNGFPTKTGAYQIGSVVRDETPTKNI
jgi:hypothetical protein